MFILLNVNAWLDDYTEWLQDSDGQLQWHFSTTAVPKLYLILTGVKWIQSNKQEIQL